MRLSWPISFEHFLQCQIQRKAMSWPLEDRYLVIIIRQGNYSGTVVKAVKPEHSW